MLRLTLEGELKKCVPLFVLLQVPRQIANENMSKQMYYVYWIIQTTDCKHLF